MSRTFPTKGAALAFRRDALKQLRLGRVVAEAYTVGDALSRLEFDLVNDTAMTRSGEPFKPSTASGYVQSIHRHLLPALRGRFAGMQVEDLSAAQVSAIRDELQAKGLDASTIRNALMPLRVLARRESERGVLERDPFRGVTLPAVRGTRDRVATAAEASILLDVLEGLDRVFYAVAFYAGLRSGEISALRWADIDLAERRLHVRRSYCSRSGRTTLPKSKASKRVVPIPGLLAWHLDVFKGAQASTNGAERVAPDELVFPSAAGRPRRGTSVTARATSIWRACDLNPIGLHEARHTYASLMAAAGVPLIDLSAFMGHSSVNLTAKTYRHLYPETIDQATSRIDEFLAAA